MEIHHSWTDKQGFYFLDEIQNIVEWEKFARRMADMKERVYITESNAGMLSHEIESTLGGRYLSKYIKPYHFREYLSASGAPWHKQATLSTMDRGRILGHFESFSTFGGFPESLLFHSCREYVSIVCQKVILGDMAARNGVRKDHVISLLIKKIAEARSVFYYHLNALKREDKHAQLKSEIESIFHEHKGRYGYRRITSELRIEAI